MNKVKCSKRRLSMKIKLKFILPMFMTVMTACASSSSDQGTLTKQAVVNIESTDSSSTSQISGSFPEKLSMEIERVKFDAEVLAHSSVNMKAKSYEPTVRKFDKEKFENKLLSNIEVAEKRSENDMDSYSGTKGEYLSVSSTAIFFYTDLYRYVNNAFSLYKDDGNAELYMKNIDFDFASREEAKESILKEFDSLGAGLGSEYFINMYSLDYETLKENEKVIDMEGEIDKSAYKADWNSKDNCYYLCIRQSVNGIPVGYKYADADENINEYNAPIQLLYSSSGIEFLSIDKMFDFSDKNEEVVLADMDKISACIAKKYNDILDERKYSVNKLELYYICVKEGEKKYTLRPAWVVTMSELGDDTPFQMIIDAQTAKELIL